MLAPVLLLRTGDGRFDRIAVDGAACTVGRSPDCTVCLLDPAVSRYHARIVRVGPLLELHDEASRIGTVLNGERVVGVRCLSNGDCIRIGDALLLVCDHTPARTDELRLEGLARAHTPVESRQVVEDVDATRVLYSIPSVVRPTMETAAAPDLALLEQVSRTLQSVTEIEDILTVLLGVAFDVLAPERGAILLRDRVEGTMRVATCHPDEDSEFVSRTILEHAIDRRSTLVVRDVAQDPRFRGVPSLHEKATRAAVCCPLITRDQLVGALYLDTTLEGLGTRRDQVGLINLVACFAATAIEAAMLLRDRSLARSLADLEEEPLVARSEAMAAFERQLEDRAAGHEPLLIVGEAGTGKLLAARQLHLAGPGPNAPFLALDCERMSARDLRSVLFGTNRDEDALAPPGAWRDTAGGTVVLEHVEALDLLAQAALVELLAASGSGPVAPRLIATTTAELAALVAQSRFHAGLHERLGPGVVRVPRLRERKEDILILARHFLASIANKQGRAPAVLGASAERTLEAAKYREANARELREAIELASTLSDGGVIEAEHVFTGPRVRAHRWEFDLGSVTAVGALLQRRVHASVGLAVLLMFLAIAGLCLARPGHGEGRVANAVVWGLWWPGLLVSFVAVGRVWCAVCPISRFARWGQSAWSLGRRPSAWIKDHARWIMAALFVLIVWSEHVFRMPDDPFATGLLLLSLMAVAFLAAAVTQREVWCRFACPLGNLSACYSVPATVHVHANPMICQSQCKTHECFKGTDEEPGCPMYLHPLYVKDSHFCKLCMSCVRNCPNGSARLWLRPPLQDVWSLGELNPGLTPLALTVFLLTPLTLAAGADGPLSGVVPYTAASVGLAFLAWPIERLLARWLSPVADPAPAARVAVALALLAWGPLMAFHLGNVPGLADLSVRAATATLEGLWPTSGLPVLAGLQVTMVLASALAAVIALASIRPGLRGSAAGPRAYGVLFLVAVLYAALCIRMVV